jgi:hypothetical protein
MDTVALLGPNIMFDVKNTFVSVQAAGSARVRAGSAPPACHYTSVVVQKRRCPDMSSRRCAVLRDHTKAQYPFAGPASPKPTRINLEKELSQCSTTDRSSTTDGCGTSEPNDDGVTIRIGNLPNRAKPERIKAFIDDMGLGGCVDSIYIPLDGKTGVGKGYAFVHFMDDDVAAEFASKADGAHLPRSNSPKQMTISYASRQAVATVPKHLPKNAKGRTFTAFLWLR